MKLPQLPDLPEDILDESTESTGTQSDSKLNEHKSKDEVVLNKSRPKVPKSRYDEDGNPVLTIPDLDDVGLLDEIDKYFGDYEEDD